MNRSRQHIRYYCRNKIQDVGTVTKSMKFHYATVPVSINYIQSNHFDVFFFVTRLPSASITE